MKLLALAVLLISMMTSLQGQNSNTPAAGLRVRGHVTGLPVDGPDGFITLELGGPNLSMMAPVRSDGTFEFTGVPSLSVGLRTTMVRSAYLTLTLTDKDVDGVELTVTQPQLLGQVVLEDGGRLPTNRDPFSPVLKLEARGAKGKTISHQFIRSDGTFGFLPLPPEEYTIRVALVPAGYSVQSISYAGSDVSRTPVNLSDPNYSFLRITLTAAPGIVAGLPGGAPDTAKITDAAGDATLVVSQSGRSPARVEGSLAFFRVRSTGPPKFDERKRLGGEWCIVSRQCDPTGPMPMDSTAFSLPAGSYEITGYVLGCDGNCGRLGPPEDECRATFEINAGSTLYAERVSKDHLCTIVISPTPPQIGLRP